MHPFVNICIRNIKHGLKRISTLNIFLIYERATFQRPITQRIRKKRFNGSRENVFKAIKIFIKPMGLRDGYSFTIVL